MKMVFVFFSLFFCGITFYVQAQTCCDKLRQAGIESYANGNYADALKKWEAAKTCASKCTTNDLDSWIKKAKDKLKPPAKTQPKTTTPTPPSGAGGLEPAMILVQGAPSGDFYIGKYEVTVGEFKAFVDATKYQTDNEKGKQFAGWKNDAPDYKTNANINWRCNVLGVKRPSSEYNHPVIFVSKKDADAYAAWLSKKTGKTYRLPTEKEWTYAASGGNKKTRQLDFYGSDDLDRIAWYKDNANGTTHPVGQKLPNELGLFDMNGNVWEWCSDWYDKSQGTYVARGGGWTGDATYCLPGNRAYGIANSTSFIGFRLIRK